MPRTLRDGDEPVGFEELPPLGQPLLEADVVNGTFGPQQVERRLGEGQRQHRGDDARDLLRPAFGLHSPVQSLDHFGQQVDGRDGTVERRCEHRRLASGAAADVGYAGTGRQAVDEAQRAACLGVVARALPVETGEKRCDDSVVEVGDQIILFLIVVVCICASAGSRRADPSDANEWIT